MYYLLVSFFVFNSLLANRLQVGSISPGGGGWGAKVHNEILDWGSIGEFSAHRRSMLSVGRCGLRRSGTLVHMQVASK